MKPFGRVYPSIGHLPGSKMGPKDFPVNPERVRLCTENVDGYSVIVSEKLDGSCCGVGFVGDEIVPVIRDGYVATSSPHEQHHIFDRWARSNSERFRALLLPGEVAIGEWMAQVHGTHYDLPHEPFVLLDIMRQGRIRTRWDHTLTRAKTQGFTVPRVISHAALTVEQMLGKLEPSGHGAVDPVEGAVWRVEYRGEAYLLAKYVRAEKVAGEFLPIMTGGQCEWNWRASGESAFKTNSPVLSSKKEHPSYG